MQTSAVFPIGKQATVTSHKVNTGTTKIHHQKKTTLMSDKKKGISTLHVKKLPNKANYKLIISYK